jgi:hypothetical protein
LSSGTFEFFDRTDLVSIIQVEGKSALLILNASAFSVKLARGIDLIESRSQDSADPVQTCDFVGQVHLRRLAKKSGGEKQWG